MSQVLRRATSLLAVLSDLELATLGELSRLSRLPPATCARLMAMLVELGWADQISPRGPYRLGLTAQLLSERRPYLEKLIDAARPVLDELVRRLHQPVVLVRLRGDRRQVLILRRPEDSSFTLSPLEDRELYATATGRLLLAHLDPRRRRQMLDLLGLPRQKQWPGIVTLKELQSELSALRRVEEVVLVTPPWDCAAIYLGTWDGEGACLGTFAPLGAMHAQTLKSLRAAKERLNHSPT